VANGLLGDKTHVCLESIFLILWSAALSRFDEQKSGLCDLLEALLSCRDDPGQFSTMRREALLAHMQTMGADRRQLAESHQSSIDRVIAVAGSPSRATEQLLGDLQDSVAVLQHYVQQLKSK
jgi:hypothetical protein